MFGIAAVICLAISLILRLLGSHAGLSADFEIGGLLALAIHLLYDWRPWTRP